MATEAGRYRAFGSTRRILCICYLSNRSAMQSVPERAPREAKSDTEAPVCPNAVLLWPGVKLVREREPGKGSGDSQFPKCRGTTESKPIISQACH